eukprot:scaffold15472_cov117-Cylindrotheca_fusiformis.AAC.8
MPEKVKGTVKWFSNRKGFGFITPSSGDESTKDDIFVHQSGIVMETKETYRTLKDGFEVEYEVITDDSGKLKAVNVHSADGTPCPLPGPKERRRKKNTGGTAAVSNGPNEGDAAADTTDEKPKSDEENNGKKKKGRKGGRKNNNNKKTVESKSSSDEKSMPENEKPPVRKPTWDSDLEEGVKQGLASRKVKIVSGKAFLAIGDSRLKLGNGGNVAFAHASGVLAEGKFTCEKNGKVTLSWERILKLDGSEWKPSTADAEKDALLSEFSLTDGEFGQRSLGYVETVQPTSGEKANKPVWGEGKADPKTALESNNFLMSKPVFHHGRGPFRRNKGKRNSKSNGNANANEGDQKS